MMIWQWCTRKSSTEARIAGTLCPYILVPRSESAQKLCHCRAVSSVSLVRNDCFIEIDSQHVVDRSRYPYRDHHRSRRFWHSLRINNDVAMVGVSYLRSNVICNVLPLNNDSKCAAIFVPSAGRYDHGHAMSFAVMDATNMRHRMIVVLHCNVLRSFA
jgi:hypothetical protein